MFGRVEKMHQKIGLSSIIFHKHGHHYLHQKLRYRSSGLKPGYPTFTYSTLFTVTVKQAPPIQVGTKHQKHPFSFSIYVHMILGSSISPTDYLLYDLAIHMYLITTIFTYTQQHTVLVQADISTANYLRGTNIITTPMLI